MSARNILTFVVFSLFLSGTAFSQDNTIPKSSDNITPGTPVNTIVSFSVSGEGYRFHPTWGLDQAWISEQNFRKGINHMGKENIGVGRSCFRTTKPLVNDASLASDPINALRNRNNIFNILNDTLPLVLTCDQEAGVDPYYRNNNTANVDHWAAMINAHVEWLSNHSNHHVIGVSPFNEPDYWTEEGATPQNSRDIAKKLKEDYPLFSTISVVGANTLNDDKAISWYTPGKEYYGWGNTHQLAGSMVNYKAFYDLLSNDGKIGYNDEMHNVAEAFIGLEHGMTVGIWWGFDSRARGEFCDISRHGVRLAYAEHPSNWTAATVYRHDNGKVKAFLGSSERQAYSTLYQFVSTDHDVYYDGQGPTREITLGIHGGTGYQQGQKNAERVIDVTWGADVAPSFIDGTYKIMNKVTQFVIAEHGELNGNPNISQVNYNGGNNQQWEVHPVGNSVDGDYSFHDIKSVRDGKHMDVLNFSTKSGANVISFGTGTPSTNQQWYLEYAGDGYYFIRNRESALYLTLTSNSKIQGLNINQQALLDDPSRQMWRFLPLDADCETNAPAVPTGLRATGHSASVLLEWDANNEEDLDGYMLLRTEQGTEAWNTIARKIKGTKFLDNTCRQDKSYSYRLKAIDKSENQSEPCEPVDVSLNHEPALIAQWTMEGDFTDTSINQLNGASFGSPTFTSTKSQGNYALNLNGSTQFAQLPYEIASSQEMSFTGWVYWRSTSLSNQRIFDFGNGPRQYMYLTPSNGTGVSLVLNDGTGDRTLSSDTRLTPSRWKHVAVTLGNNSAIIYVDGEKVAESSALDINHLDIRPCLNYLGRGQRGDDPKLKAYLDDIRIYNYALTPDEVKNVMDDAASIHHPSINQSGTAPEYYTTSGIRVESLDKKGIYIERGNRHKIIVK